MKNLLLGLFVFIGLLGFTAVHTVSAAPAAATGKIGPYEGVFQGTIYAPDGSEAPMSLDLTHRGNVVEGTVFLGNGLTIDAGMCGQAAIPASTVEATGTTSLTNPQKLSTSSVFDVSGITVKVLLDSAVQGDTLTAQAKVDLPWLCGNDPVLTGTLQRG
jgi:hypothetical protein